MLFKCKRNIPINMQIWIILDKRNFIFSCKWKKKNLFYRNTSMNMASYPYCHRPGLPQDQSLTITINDILFIVGDLVLGNDLSFSILRPLECILWARLPDANRSSTSQLGTNVISISKVKTFDWMSWDELLAIRIHPTQSTY